MSALHTPAPWEASDPGDYSDFDGQSRVILGDDMRIAVVHWNDTHNQAMCDANACLIAAAPALLLAGLGVWNNVLNGDIEATTEQASIALSQLRAAIASTQGDAA
ncbi:MAG: hypothetical protein V4657_13490 [Pseudomonadota bacterium]